MHQKRLAAGLCLNPLGELKRYPNPLAALRGWGLGREGKGKRERRKAFCHFLFYCLTIGNE